MFPDAESDGSALPRALRTSFFCFVLLLCFPFKPQKQQAGEGVCVCVCSQKEPHILAQVREFYPICVFDWAEDHEIWRHMDGNYTRGYIRKTAARPSSEKGRRPHAGVMDFGYFWVWVKIKPPRGPQVLVHVFPSTRVPFWVPIFDPQPFLGVIKDRKCGCFPLTHHFRG